MNTHRIGREGSGGKKEISGTWDKEKEVKIVSLFPNLQLPLGAPKSQYLLPLLVLHAYPSCHSTSSRRSCFEVFSPYPALQIEAKDIREVFRDLQKPLFFQANHSNSLNPQQGVVLKQNKPQNWYLLSRCHTGHREAQTGFFSPQERQVSSHYIGAHPKCCRLSLSHLCSPSGPAYSHGSLRDLSHDHQPK